MKDDVAFTNCRIVNVENGSIGYNETIIIRNESVLEVGQLKLPYESDIKIMDMQGMWVLPGIIDLHVHICEEADPILAADFSLKEPEIITGIRASKNLNEAIIHGITTVRDAGAHEARNIKVGQGVLKKVIIGPKIYSCGYLITYPQGHMHDHGIQIRGSEQAREAVKKNIELGADYIKIASDPEDTEAKGRTPNPALIFEELNSVTEEAHRSGLKVAVHTFPSIKGVTTALKAGVDTLEHAVPLTDKILECFIRQDVIIVPTFVAAYDEYPLKIVVDRLGISWQKLKIYEVTNYSKKWSEPLRPNGVPESIAIWFDYLLEYLPIAIENNVRIGIGTDAGCVGTNFRSAIREMFLLTQLGATNLQVIQYATLNGAKALGSEVVGKIESGYQADLIFLDQNPIEKLEALLNVKLVVTRGNLISKEGIK